MASLLEMNYAEMYDKYDVKPLSRKFTMDAETMNQLDAWRRKRTLSNRRGISCSTIRRTETKWIQIQHKTFTKWVSQHTGDPVNDFRVDLIDGVLLLKLVERLSGKRVKRSHSKPVSISQKCDNIQLALDICKSEDVKLTNIGTQDIAAGSLKLMLGLVWCLIQRYHLIAITRIQDPDIRRSSIGKTDNESFKVRVIRGLNLILGKMNLRVNNLKSDWSDGMFITALVTYLAPIFNKDFMNIEREEYVSATSAAMLAAQQYLGIPCLLSADDFTSADVDDLSMITYLSYYLDPEHLSVRERYLFEHPNYTPAYRTYIQEPDPPVCVESVCTQSVCPQSVTTATDSVTTATDSVTRETKRELLTPVTPECAPRGEDVRLDNKSHSNDSVSNRSHSNDSVSNRSHSNDSFSNRSHSNDSISNRSHSNDSIDLKPLNGQKSNSPIKKLFNSYKTQLQDIRTKTLKRKGREGSSPYKEPYKIRADEYDENHKKLSSSQGPVLVPRDITSSNQKPVSVSHDNTSANQCPVSVPRDNTSSNQCPVSVPRDLSHPNNTGLLQHHKHVNKHSRCQCDKTCNKCAPQLIQHYDTKRVEVDHRVVEFSPDTDTLHTASDTLHTADQELSDSETQDILDKILNASDGEEEAGEEDTDNGNDTVGTLRRCNTTVLRNRPAKMTNKAESKHTELQPFFRDHELFAEYKLLCNNVPSGVYVVPSFKSLQIWHGMIFIKIGMFADGCFKFNLYIPDNFPYARPSLRFLTPVFHPQVKPSGELNLAKAFPTWTPRKDRIWHVLRYTKRCFFSINTFDATNSAAAEAVHKSIDTFRNKAKQCVENSIRINISEPDDTLPEDDGNVFNVRPLPDEDLKRIKDKLIEGVKTPFQLST